APILDQVGQRVRPEYLRSYLADTHAAKPGATMPAMVRGVDEQTRRTQIEALTHFLASSGQPADSAPVRQSIASGENLFHSVGCVACHNPRDAKAPKLATSVPLPELSAKYTIGSLAAFLQEPLAVRPAGRMPHLNLKAEEARDIAHYLLQDIHVEPNVAFEYYEGGWDNLPDFSTLKPKTTGKCSGFDVLAGERRDQFAMRFTAFLNLSRDGKYRFHLGSDDGSRLLIDGQQVVVNDGIHPHSFKSGEAELKAGVHELVVEYFEQGGEESCQVDIEGPGLGRQSVEAFLVLGRDGKVADQNSKPAFELDGALAEQGKSLFASVGCATCHQAAGIPRGASGYAAEPKSLVAMKSTGGCLAETPPAAAPDYALSDAQRTALSAAIGWLQRQTNPPNNDEIIRHTMTAFNCFACHQRGEMGGVERDRDAYFKSDQQEMGDEGRIPPHLTGVGAKLTEGWLKQVFDNGAKDRPYMFTRMPRFGTTNVGQLVSALATADPAALADVKIPEPEIAPRRLKSAGRQLVGASGFSCIKCHTFGGSKATGIQSINMTTMTRRLRPEWFHQYMLNPQAYRPGTRMPAAWPQGQVLLPNVLDGTPDTQIHSVWSYLSDGDKASPPTGLGSDPEELYVIDEAVIYRNFIEGAGPRAIAVGYPEKVNLAFDANNLNIALLWHNAFMDASRHWSGRGQGFQGPLGDNVLRLTANQPFAALADAETSWPTENPRDNGYRFRGYRLGKAERPTFLYEYDGIAIEDFPEAALTEQFSPLRRTLTLTRRGSSAGGKLHYRAAVGDTIEPAEDGWFTINGTWKTRIEGAKAVVRHGSGKAELLVPIEVANQPVMFTQIYAW
ncbi:MAG: c-type cytochrome, partial [Planctomycetales bacterium]|nr:c-type cytochrome [Planctomycetales bacterium]